MFFTNLFAGIKIHQNKCKNNFCTQQYLPFIVFILNIRWFFSYNPVKLYIVRFYVFGDLSSPTNWCHVNSANGRKSVFWKVHCYITIKPFFWNAFCYWLMHYFLIRIWMVFPNRSFYVSFRSSDVHQRWHVYSKVQFQHTEMGLEFHVCLASSVHVTSVIFNVLYLQPNGF